MNTLDFNPATRHDLLKLVTDKLEHYYSETESYPVSAEWDIQQVRDSAHKLQLETGNKAADVVEQVVAGLSNFAVHTPHPSYYGLFNPRPGFASIIGDLITATFNPQLAAWSHSPFANEIERHIIFEMGRKFGYRETIDGTFCSGGAESNLTAVVSALNFQFPNFNEEGAAGIGKAVIYCSTESHHSILKAAKITGIGARSVQSVAVNEQLQIDPVKLEQQILLDQQNGRHPFLIVGTAGTTGSGAIDDLDALAEIAQRHWLWFHVDAAYGGAMAISKKHGGVLKGLGKADSITVDLHKWFSIPMGASLFVTKNDKILGQSFEVKTSYMPEDGDQEKVVDHYIHSTQWSRRFNGLKMYLPLAIHGWEGYEKTIDHQIEMGDLLKELLLEKSWTIENQTALPIICFSHPDLGEQGEGVSTLVKKIEMEGKAWVSEYPIHSKNTIRACITNYATTRKELEALVQMLETAK